jgi:hypothetical protein
MGRRDDSLTAIQFDADHGYLCCRALVGTVAGTCCFWGIGLVLYGLGTFSEAFLELAWSPVMVRLWHLAGTMLTAAWLGQGTLYLLVHRPGVAHAVMVVEGCRQDPRKGA